MMRGGLFVWASAIFSEAAVDFITNQLGWKSDGHYEEFSNAVAEAWDRGNTVAPFTSLRQALATDPRLLVMIAAGTIILFLLAAAHFEDDTSDAYKYVSYFLGV